ncbi:MAG: hypothetical protein ACYC5U_01525, partial [Rhodocyclaceae bacterium]
MNTVVAALSQPLGPSGFREFRILPAGMFRSADGSGRPVNVTAWLCRGFLDLSGSVAFELSAFWQGAGSGGGRSPQPVSAPCGAPGG